MSTLITLDNISLAYGLDHLLDQVKLQIDDGERVCLIGRNGAGKSSLLKIIEGSLLADSGQISRKPNLRLARLTQELPYESEDTVYDFVAKGLAGTGQVIADYHHLLLSLEHSSSESQMKQLEILQAKMDTLGAWQYEQNIIQTLTRLELPSEKRMGDLSGGWLRRAALAQALVSSPELLLLDEPTNHLDIASIEYLENFLLETPVAIVFITHDRSFLQKLATRIIELDRGNLSSWPGDYQNYLRRKEERLHAEAQLNALFDKKLAEEEVWIRQGIKARRTRNEGRVRALEALRRERSERRELQGKASFQLNEAKSSGRLVAELEHVSHRFHDTPIIQDFSLRIMRGDRLAFLGPNGIGKSTLLNIILGTLIPDQGKVSQGTQLQIAFFDQMRAGLDLEKTVIDNVVQGSDMIEIQGKKRHIISYLGDFLFTPQRARTPVKSLSGGEANRLLLAKLFSRPANLLVLDEPTNDLDVETLELLEELLNQFDGTILLVSHDRKFVDNVVTSTLVFLGEGKIQECIGGYQEALAEIQKSREVKKTIVQDKSNKTKTKPSQKLSFKDQREFDELPERIDALEKSIKSLETEVSDPSFYQNPAEKINARLADLKLAQEKLETAFQRWHELDAKQGH